MPEQILTLLKEITLNLDTPNDLVYVVAKQYDALTRKVKIKLLYNHEPWVIPAGLQGVIRYLKPDNTRGMYDTDDDGNSAIAITTGSNASHPGYITITLARQVLTAKGTVKIEVSLYSAAAEKLTTFAFPLVVEEAALSDLPFYESEDYYNFRSDMAAIQKLAQSFESATQAAISGTLTIDNTLSIQGAIADAKAAGDMILVSETEPEETSNILWIQDPDEEIKIAEISDIQDAFKEEYSVLSDIKTHDLPEGYTEKFYIENLDGGLLISTGITWYSAVKVVIDVESTGGVFFGQSRDASRRLVGAFGRSSTGSKQVFRYGGPVYEYTEEYLNKRCLVELCDTYLSFNGEIVSEFSAEAGGTSSAGIRLFGHRSYGANPAQYACPNTKIYGAKIYKKQSDNWTLVYEGVPCVRNSDGTIGIYDLVSNGFSTAEEGYGTGYLGFGEFPNIYDNFAETRQNTIDVHNKVDALYDSYNINWSEVFSDPNYPSYPLGWQRGVYKSDGSTSTVYTCMRTLYGTVDKDFIPNEGDIELVYTVPEGYCASIIEFEMVEDQKVCVQRYGNPEQWYNTITIPLVQGHMYRFMVGYWPDGNVEEYITAAFLSNVIATVKRTFYSWQLEQEERIVDLCQRVDVLDADIKFPSYYNNYLLEKLDAITDRRNLMSMNTDEFFVIADTHHQYNQGYSYGLLRYMAHYTGITKLFHAGDLGGVHGDDYFWQVARRFQMATDCWQRYSDCVDFMYGVTGNHEHIHSPMTRAAQTDAYLNKYRMPPTVMDITTGNYYVDNTFNKIRYLFVQNNASAVPVDGSAAWLLNTLSELPSDYAVTLTIHYAYVPQSATLEEYDGVESSFSAATKRINEILHAFRFKSTFTYNDITYDFANKSGIVIGIFSGHRHHGFLYVDDVNTEVGGVRVFIASTDTTHASGIAVNGKPFYWSNGPGSTKIVREKGTVNEQCFYVVQVDLDNREMYITAIGGDHDWSCDF